MGDSVFEGPPNQNAQFLKRHGPRNAIKQSPEEGPKLDPKKVRKISDFGVNFGGRFWLRFFLFGSLGPLLAQRGPLLAHFGPLLAHVGPLLSHLGPFLALLRVILGPSCLVLGPSWPILGLPCLILSLPGLAIGTPLPHLGASLGPFACPHL